MGKQMRKLWCTCTTGYYAAIQNEILPFAITWKDLEGIMLNEISQTEKDICCIISFYVESKKKNQKPELIDTGDRLVVVRGRE